MWLTEANSQELTEGDLCVCVRTSECARVCVCLVIPGLLCPPRMKQITRDFSVRKSFNFKDYNH